MSLDEVMKKVAEEVVAARKERAAWFNHNTKMVQLGCITEFLRAADCLLRRSSCRI